MKKTVIIGGVAGGATAAARLRRRDEDREIVILERGGYISYANCGLPYYTGDVIQSKDALLLQTPENMKEKYNIDVRVHNEVVQINPTEKAVIVKNLETGETYSESYGELIIATGSAPIRPTMKGIDLPAVKTIWTVPDAVEIREMIERQQAHSAVIIGGGFIGVEMAENLRAAGLHVTLVEKSTQVMNTLDTEMAELLHENMALHEVELLLGEGVEGFEETAHGVCAYLESGRQVTADLVILAIGVRPNSQLAKDAGLELNQRGGICVDEQMRTSVADIYAVGDVIEVPHGVLDEKTMIPLAGPANKQARICADVIMGDDVAYDNSLGTNVAQIFDLAAASVGVNEKTLQQRGLEKGKDYESVIIDQKSHAGYYPGATMLTLKLIFDKSGNIYGAQIVGVEGVDKRIDTIAVVMKMKGHVADLARLELAYAPPFSSAKDPVNMLGFTAENILHGLAVFVTPTELDARTAGEAKDKIVILDVTEDVERMVYHIEESYHIPLGQLRERYTELDPAKEIIVYCAVGVRSYNAARFLMQRGYKHVKILAGGTTFYKSMHWKERGSTAHISKISENERLGANNTEITKHQIQKEIKILDCSGLQCPGPIMKVNEAVSEMQDGEELKVSATDLGFMADMKAWCERTGNTYLKTEQEGKYRVVYLRKGTVSTKDESSAGTDPNGVCTEENRKSGAQNMEPQSAEAQAVLPQGKTMIVFDGDLDKALAAFIIANGAAAMGRPVTMFFTFWGLNILRKDQKINVNKSVVEKMFGAMMPRGSRKLKLSNMNMGGMGTKMMRKVMEEKNVDSLEMLMAQAIKNGVRVVACTMSMDVMGIRPEELIDGVELAGVASYLGDAEQSNVNLFI